jgi:2-polyprenyl-6-hydroxyphenyl methylase/3-demethylubiquinone-9 3-methyltransferase
VDVLEHVEDLRAVIAEVARVMRPGGVFLYDTINATRLARFAMVAVAENTLGLLPRGTHNPEQFIRPHHLESVFVQNGLRPGPRHGLGPRGVNLRLDPVFGPVPGDWILYAGHATRISG